MNDQETLINGSESKSEWLKMGMPIFKQEDLMSWQSIVVHFPNEYAREQFAKLIDQKISHKTRSLWYPKADIGHFAGKSYVSSLPFHRICPRYPVYVISKGRWKSRMTVKALERIKVPFEIVVEPQEYDKYAEHIDPKKILKLPKEGFGGGCSIPARNWCWNHSRKRGAARHWILDDNIEGFYRLHENLKTPVGDSAIFRAAEDFTDCYTNVAMSGFNYFMFAPRKSAAIKPYSLNTRVYSCILLSNTAKTPEDEPYAWRGRYNEDTDLSLRILKDGWCTVLFNAFLAFKQTTMSMVGGNTESLYVGVPDGRLEMAKSLKKQHPGVVHITHKWGRFQHHVDYTQFRKNRLKARPDLQIQKVQNNYGMELQVVQERREKTKKFLREKAKGRDRAVDLRAGEERQARSAEYIKKNK